MEEKDKLQVHPYKPVSWSPTHQGNEWATTKQACRDELVAYLSIYIYKVNTQGKDQMLLL